MLKMIKCQDSCKPRKFNGCCVSCPHKSDCPEVCKYDPKDCGSSYGENSETALTVFKQKSTPLVRGIAELATRKAEIEAAEKELRVKLEAAMVEHGIKKIDHDILKITYVEPSTRTGVDGKKLEATYPHIYAECSKTSNVKGHIKIEIKKR